MNTTGEHSNDQLVISYLGLRRAVGLVGLLFPLTLWVGKEFLGPPGLLESVSAYYHTVMQDVFVGALCVMGMFLMSYRGFDWRDNLAGDAACVFALGIAFFPTLPPESVTPTDELLSLLHNICAVGFFTLLAVFCLYLFRKHGPDPTPEKLLRNKIYLGCGLAIVVCMLVIGVLAIWDGLADALDSYQPVFVLETIAIMSFGVSWLTKGEWIAGDPPLKPPA